MSQTKELMPGVPLFRASRIFDKPIRSKRDIEKISRIYVIGTVPHVASGKPLCEKWPSKEEEREAFQQISNNLVFFFTKADQRVIGVHSVKSRAGKSYVAGNLASCLAVSGKKVLLIGANLRKPGLMRYADPGRLPGLGSCLQGEEFKKCIKKIGPGELWLLPEGQAENEPGELFGSELFRTLIVRGKEEFDYIVLDNAPALAGADALAAGLACDLNLFVLKAGRSRRSEIRFIHHLTGYGAMRNLALVLNDIPTK